MAGVVKIATEVLLVIAAVKRASRGGGLAGRCKRCEGNRRKNGESKGGGERTIGGRGLHRLSPWGGWLSWRHESMFAASTSDDEDPRETGHDGSRFFKSAAMTPTVERDRTGDAKFSHFGRTRFFDAETQNQSLG